jgi:phosphoglycerate dehydrogenase-like enzyme
MKILYPTNVDEPPKLAGGDELVWYDPTAPVPSADEDADVLVSWGGTVELLRDAAHRMPSLRWVQGLAAGPDDVLAAGFGEHVVITTGRSLHSDTVAEHALALILAGLRGLHLVVADQPAHRWRGDLGGPRVERPDGRLETLHKANVLIWGFGSIAERLAPLLTALGARISGVARSEGRRAGYPVHPANEIPALLPRTDVLVMILPHEPDAAPALTGELIDLLPDRSWVVNVGRGTTIDEPALAAALAANRLAGAALDVFQTEPLPADSPLWDLPNVILTPHTAGGRPRDAARLVERNLAALRAGERLVNQVRP